MPAQEDFLGLIRSVSTGSASVAGDSVTLRAFVGFDEVRSAAMTARTLSSRLGQLVAELTRSVDSIVSDHNGLLDAFDGSTKNAESRSLDESEEPAKLLEEMQILVKKISSDFEHVASLPDSAKAASQVSKLALLHTRNYLPSLTQYAQEMNELHRTSVEQRNQAQTQAVQHMQTISSIESRLSGMTAELDGLSVPADAADALDTLSLVSRLPQIYGSVLIEVVRRHEWIEKMKRDSSMLAEELAGYQTEEDRRRKKWLKTMNDVLVVESFEQKALGVEINLQNEENAWPLVARSDLYDYVTTLTRTKGLELAAEQVGQAVRDMDRPTKQQSKSVKAFKMGSVHETSLGSKRSLMLRGEDDVQSLRTANAKLEDELKSQKSRVRKLEDLLHRQSQSSRPLSGAFTPQPMSDGTPTETPTAASHRGSSPAPARPSHELSRKSSVSSRRYSSNINPDERGLVNKILKLEAELQEERERRSGLERNAATANATEPAQTDMRQQVAEAISTKKDIMENMEAQQREFATERRSLEDEIGRYKLRLEELEDEVEGILGSRDNEKHGNESRVRALEGEIVKVREEADVARREYMAEDRELLATIFETLAPRSVVSVEEGAEEKTKKKTERDIALEMHSADLLKAIADRAETFSKQYSDLHKRRSELTERRKMLSSRLHTKEIQMRERDEQLEQLRSQVAAERANAASVTGELNDQRRTVTFLRTKLEQDTSGSDALRARLTDEENRVERLTGELKASRSHVNSLDVELSSLQTQFEKVQGQLDATRTKMKLKAQRARGLKGRLVDQRARLMKLLETLGFAVSYGEGGELVVQRASKAGAGSTVLMPDGWAGKSGSTTAVTNVGTSQGRAVEGESTAVSTAVSLQASTDLAGVQGRQDTDTQKRVDNNNNNNNLDVDDESADDDTTILTTPHITTICDTITKRMRDIEHTARKWQKEARAYRDRSHRLQTDAHDKIAFRAFREGDLALFLPTRNQAARPWAAFNSGAPHYFLRETDAHRLANREYLVARIARIEERVVDLGGSAAAPKGRHGDGERGRDRAKGRDGSTGRDGERGRVRDKDDTALLSSSTAAAQLTSPSTSTTILAPPTSMHNSSNTAPPDPRDSYYASPNPFDLSDGLRWYLLDAVEEKAGAPATPGLGKSTVASAHVDARGSIRRTKNSSLGSAGDVSRTLNRSLDSRRSSSGSKVGSLSGVAGTIGGGSTGAGAGAGGSAAGAGGVGGAGTVVPPAGGTVNMMSGSSSGGAGLGLVVRPGSSHSQAVVDGVAGGPAGGVTGSGAGSVNGSGNGSGNGNGSGTGVASGGNSARNSISGLGIGFAAAMLSPASNTPPTNSHLSITESVDEGQGDGRVEERDVGRGDASEERDAGQEYQHDEVRRQQLPGP